MLLNETQHVVVTLLYQPTLINNITYILINAWD